MGTDAFMRDDLHDYLKQINDIPLLSASEELYLARIIAKGREAASVLHRCTLSKPTRRRELTCQVDAADIAREQMVEANTRLVVKVANRFSNRGLPLKDLVQEGNIGLLKAVDRFDFRLGFRLSTYAMHWIVNAMRQAIFEQGRGLRLPANIRTQLRQLWQSEEILLAELGCQPSSAELAAHLDWDLERIKNLRKWAQDPASLDQPVADGQDSIMADFIADEKVKSPLDEVTRQLLHEQLHTQLRSLPNREAEILRLRFGLQGDPHTLEETARYLDLSVPQVRNMEASALSLMRTSSLRRAALAAV